jgi:hypothetical protein
LSLSRDETSNRKRGSPHCWLIFYPYRPLSLHF